MPTAAPAADALAAFVERKWDAEIVPQLVEYVRTPAKSPHFDRDWAAHGHIEAVVRQAEAWCRAQPIADMALEVVRLPGRTPLLFFEIPGSAGTPSSSTGISTSSPR